MWILTGFQWGEMGSNWGGSEGVELVGFWQEFVTLGVGFWCGSWGREMK